MRNKSEGRSGRNGKRTLDATSSTKRVSRTEEGAGETWTPSTIESITRNPAIMVGETRISRSPATTISIWETNGPRQTRWTRRTKGDFRLSTRGRLVRRKLTFLTWIMTTSTMMTNLRCQTP